MKYRINLKPSSHYRLPFQGSKNLIAEKLFKVMHDMKPEAYNFIDLFGGGGAMSCYALECGYNVFYNEYRQDIKELFEWSLMNDELNNTDSIYWDFVSKVKFDYYKKITPKSKEEEIQKSFYLLCYSFGNNYTSYYCSMEKEYEKKAGHNLILRLDNKSIDYYYKILGDNVYYLEGLLKEYFVKLPDYYDRYLLFRDLIIKIEFLTSLGVILPCELEDLLRIGQSELKKKYIKSEKRIERVINSVYLQQIQQINRIHQVERLKYLHKNISFYNLDYEEAFKQVRDKINKENSIIYCDSPYINTHQYKNVIFDFNRYKRFLDRLNSEGWLVFFSEYTNYDNYYTIWQQEKRINASHKKKLGNIVEKLFINTTYEEYCKKEYPLLA